MKCVPETNYKNIFLIMLFVKLNVQFSTKCVNIHSFSLNNFYIRTCIHLYALIIKKTIITHLT